MAASPGGIEVGRISLRVVPDTSHLGADLKVALDRIEAQTDLRISTSIDTTDLDIQARAAVDQAQAAAGDLHIKTEVDTSQVREAETVLRDASGSADGFSSSLGGIATAAILLGPALIPVGAVLSGLVATLAAPLAIVGGGLTLFGLLAGFAVSQTQKQLAIITAAQKKLDGLTKGTTAYADAAKQLKAAQGALSPEQVKFQTALSNVKNAILRPAITTALLKPIVDGLDLLASVLPLLTPIIKTVSGFLDSLIGRFDKFAKSPGFKDFVRAFAHQLGPDLRAFATIAGNVFQGLFGLFGNFNKELSGNVLKSLENLTAKFATWGQTLGQSKGFKSFVTYVRDAGPKVAAALGAIALAAVAIVTAFAPIGSVVLATITSVATAISKIPTDVLTTLAVAVVALVAGMKLLGPLQGIITGIIAAPEVAVVVALVAGLTLGFIALYQRSKALRQILADLGDFFKTQLLPIIETAAGVVGNQLSAAFSDISKSIRENKPFLEALGKALLIVVSEAVISGLLIIAANIRIIGKVIAVGITVVHKWADLWLLEIAFIIRAIGLMQKVVLASFGSIVDAAASAFGWIPKVGKNFTNAQQSFHNFADSANKSLSDAANSVDNFRHHLDAATAPPKPIKITVDDLKAIKDLQALQAFRFRDKNVNVTTTFLERVVGPGGGIGHPSTNSGNNIFAPVPAPASASPRSAGTTAGHGGSGGDTFNIEAHDYNDFLRQLQSRRRGRSGGGVLLDRAGVR